MSWLMTCLTLNRLNLLSKGNLTWINFTKVNYITFFNYINLNRLFLRPTIWRWPDVKTSIQTITPKCRPNYVQIRFIGLRPGANITESLKIVKQPICSKIVKQNNDAFLGHKIKNEKNGCFKILWLAVKPFFWLYGLP